jgi:hypothetical protein
VLVELSVMEQRYQAVLAVVQDGWKVTEVAARLGVSRQSVHAWIAATNWGACPRWLTGRIAGALALTRSPPRSRRLSASSAASTRAGDPDGSSTSSPGRAWNQSPVARASTGACAATA